MMRPLSPQRGNGVLFTMVLLGTERSDEFIQLVVDVLVFSDKILNTGTLDIHLPTDKVISIN